MASVMCKATIGALACGLLDDWDLSHELGLDCDLNRTRCRNCSPLSAKGCEKERATQTAGADARRHRRHRVAPVAGQDGMAAGIAALICRYVPMQCHALQAAY